MKNAIIKRLVLSFVICLVLIFCSLSMFIFAGNIVCGSTDNCTSGMSMIIALPIILALSLPFGPIFLFVLVYLFLGIEEEVAARIERRRVKSLKV